MSVKVTIKEEKEKLNELLGQLLAWGLVATLIGKLLGFKFNLQSDENMTKWGFSLGEAFKFSRQKLKNSGISPQDQQRVDRILSTADTRIRRLVQTQAARLRTGTVVRGAITVDNDITRICDDAVNQIDNIIKDRRHAEEYVAPLRATFDELRGGLETTRREAALNALTSDVGFRRSVERSLATGGRPADPALVDATMRSIAERIAGSL